MGDLRQILRQLTKEAINPQDSEELKAVEFQQLGLSDGFIGSASPREIPLGATQSLDHIRFEEGAIRKDFGVVPLGAVAASRVLGLVDHLMYQDDTLVQRLVRIIRHTDGKARIEIFDGDDWVLGIDSSVTIEDVFLSVLSIQGDLLVADGTQILRWNESIPIVEHEDDFPSANSLTAVGDTTQIVVDPGGSVSGLYTIHFSVDITLTEADSLEVEVSVELNGVEIASRTFYTEATEEWPEEEIIIEEDILLDDTVDLKFKSLVVDGTSRVDVFDYDSGRSPAFAATKSYTPESVDDSYTWVFDLNRIGEKEEGQSETEYPVLIGFYAKPAGSWILLESILYGRVEDGIRQTLVVDGMGTGDQFGIDIISEEGPGGRLGLNAKRVEWEEAVIAVDIHGFNKATDSDPAAGLTYPQEGEVSETFAPISGAPGASMLASFGDRAIALQDGADPQSFHASADGDITEWTAGDSLDTTLLDTRVHPIDDLMSFVPLGSNVAALIRKRSIMRCFETGNVEYSVGAVHWLDGIGTGTRFSAEQVEGGAMFLGHDYMVYYITEAGIKPVGGAIQKELIRTFIANPDAVDSAYDPIFQEFVLGIPEDGASHITALWFFDLGQFLETQVMSWRKRSLDCQRIKVVSRVPKSSTPDVEYTEGDVAEVDTVDLTDEVTIDVTIIEGLWKSFPVSSYATITDTLLFSTRDRALTETVELRDWISVDPGFE